MTGLLLGKNNLIFSGSDSDYSGASLATILLPDSDYVSDSELASVSSWCSEIDIGSIAPQTGKLSFSNL
jgi:hypothetical protein